MQYFDSQRDPDNSNSVASAYYWMSLSSTATTVSYATTTFPNLQISAAPNFPESSAYRYLVNLPGEPYYSDIIAGNSTFVVKNINTSSFLTRVPPGTALSVNTYKIFSNNSDRRSCLEVHVGVGSNQPSDYLSFNGRFISSVITSTNLNSLNAFTTSALPENTNGIKDEYIKFNTSDSSITTTTIIKKTAVIEIPPWDMDANDHLYFKHNISTTYINVLSILYCNILSDTTGGDYNQTRSIYITTTAGDLGGWVVGYNYSSTNYLDGIAIQRYTNGFFDKSNYSSTSQIRGWIIAEYW